MPNKTEYALEVYDKRTDRFIRQVDVFDTYEDALTFSELYPLMDYWEFYRITEIEYNYIGAEIGICT